MTVGAETACCLEVERVEQVTECCEDTDGKQRPADIVRCLSSYSQQIYASGALLVGVP